MYSMLWSSLSDSALDSESNLSNAEDSLSDIDDITLDLENNTADADDSLSDIVDSNIGYGKQCI